MPRHKIAYSRLKKETERLLHHRPRSLTLRQIADDLKRREITEPWLAQFSKGNIADPGVSKIEALYEYLSGKSII